MKTKIKVTAEQQAWIAARGKHRWSAVVARINTWESKIVSLHAKIVDCKRECATRRKCVEQSGYNNESIRFVANTYFFAIFEIVVED